jgi:hypothetical protein
VEARGTADRSGCRGGSGTEEPLEVETGEMEREEAASMLVDGELRAAVAGLAGITGSCAGRPCEEH